MLVPNIADSTMITAAADLTLNLLLNRLNILSFSLT